MIRKIMGNKPSSNIATEDIKNLARRLGADTVGIARADAVKNNDKFIEWLDNGFAGGMNYLAKYQAERFDPRILLSGAESIVVIGINYYPIDEDKKTAGEPFRVARYAWGEDYHHVLRKILRRLRSELISLQPNMIGRICVDTAPFMDKYWAQMAGLGWQGKHTNLISKEFGNWLLLGALIITAKVDNYDSSEKNHCGNCHRCIDACPTGAIVKPHRLDATRCLSYWTIESKEDQFPENIAKNMNRWVFGCDLCLLACPFNKFEKQHEQSAFRRLSIISHLENGTIADLSQTEFDNSFARSPIKRPLLTGIIRNIDAARKFL
jgi:epoxyqueuosine reductase